VGIGSVIERAISYKIHFDAVARTTYMISTQKQQANNSLRKKNSAVVVSIRSIRERTVFRWHVYGHTTKSLWIPRDNIRPRGGVRSMHTSFE
jgi:hypothetical protein